MPNRSNIDAPITLVGFGRSGSSLLSNVFGRHPDFQFVGETTNLIFGSWYAVEYSAGNIPALQERYRFVPEDERAGRVVRETFLTCFPDSRRYWFHKPIGVPTTVVARFDQTQWSDAAEWFWKVMHISFPKGKFFTLLRNPCDIVLSGKAYWGYDELTMWWALGYMAYLLAHPASPIEYAISYDSLVRNSEEEMYKLFTYLDIPFHREMLSAFSDMYAVAQDRAKSRPGVMTRRDQWSQLDPSHAKPLYIESLTTLFRKHGQEFELPDHFSGDRQPAPAASEPSAALIDAPTSLEQRQATEIHHRNQTLERLHLEYTKKALEKERKFYNIRLEDRQRIVELERLKLRIFESESKRRQRDSLEQLGVIERQRRWIKELVRGNTWWQEQAVLWRAEAERLTRAIHSQQNGIAGLDLDAARAAEQRAYLQAEQAYNEDFDTPDDSARAPTRPAGRQLTQRILRRAKRDLTRYAGRLRWSLRRFVSRQRS